MKSGEINKHVDLFRELLDKSIEPEKLRKVLTQLYFNYSRLIIRDCENGQGVPEDTDSQLYFLTQVIEVCDAQTVYPQFPDVLSNYARA